VQNALTKRSDVIIHVRSVFLQGILIATARVWPKVNGVQAKTILACLNALVKKFKRKSKADLCLAYVRAQAWITSAVVGQETVGQLKENIKLFLRSALTVKQCAAADSYFKSNIPVELLDPSKWGKSG